MHFREIRLTTSHLAHQRAFYADTLGLPVLDENAAQFTLKVGATRLTFRQGREARYHFAFNVPENQIEQAQAWVRERTPLITSEGQIIFPSENWNADMFYFADPAGNVLECIARHDLPNASELPFSSASLLNLSEIGLAAEAPQAASARIREAFGVAIYRDSSDNFVPTGDEHGLLIIVRVGRIWFPNTGVPAQVLPLEVMLDSGAGLEVDPSGMLHIRT